jgi:glucose-1-phosphate thymidylyltransferase
MLGDNIFFDDLATVIQNFKKGAYIFLKEVSDPERFGVAEIAPVGAYRDTLLQVASLEEKPKKPKSNYAVTGCYLYDSDCFKIIKNLKPSARGELEITDVSKEYLARGELTATVLKKEWVDAGTFESLFRAAELVRAHRSN